MSIIKNYRDADGLVAPHPVARPDTDRDVSGNGLLYLGQAVALGLISPADFLLTVRKCQIEPGLFKRTPSNVHGQNQHDDYIGLGLGARWGAPQLAKEILNYGKKSLGFFNNIKPGKRTLKAFIFRQIVLIPHLKYSSLQRVGLIGQLVWAGGVAAAAFTIKATDTSGPLLIWTLLKANPTPSLVERFALAFYRRRLARAFPGGFAQCAEIYYSSGHPITEAMKEKGE